MEFDCTPAEEVVLGTLEGVLEELEGHKGLKGDKAVNGLDGVKALKGAA